MTRLSLAARLAVVFTLITLVTFYFLGTYLYQTLYAQLVKFDTSEIVIKAGHLRSMIATEDSVSSLLEHASRFSGQTSGNDAFVQQILSVDGHVLLSFNPSRLEVQTSHVIPIDQPIHLSEVRRWRSSAGTDLQGIAAQGRFRDGGVAIIAVSCTFEPLLSLLSHYRNTVIQAVALGAALALALSYLLVRQALRPLQRIALEANRITMEELDTRLDASDLSPELRDLSASLNGMFLRLQQGFDLLLHYTENLAHDLRTPINNLLGQTGVMLVKERSAEEYQALLASNIEEYERLRRMIENILFLARAGNTLIALDRKGLDLREQLRHVAAYFEGLADDNDVSLHVAASGTIEADSVLLRRAVSNLLSNALRYTPRGGTIEIEGTPVEDGSAIVVSNPGVGIAPEHIAKIFERFYRADEARTNSSDSAGLGLAIVRSIMDLHRGSASAESFGGVTRFRLFFPAHTP